MFLQRQYLLSQTKTVIDFKTCLIDFERFTNLHKEASTCKIALNIC